MNYLNGTITKDEYLEQKKKKNLSTYFVSRSIFRQLELFSENVFDKEFSTVISDIRIDFENNHRFGKLYNFLQKFVDWMFEDHPDIMISVNQTKLMKPL